jgi:hypothetical protein
MTDYKIVNKFQAAEVTKLRIKVDRDSVCSVDDIDDRTKIFYLDNDATYEDLFHLLKKNKYFPYISGNNVVWVLTNAHYDCIFSYFTKTGKFSKGLYENKMKKICNTSDEVFLKYYSNPQKWKKEIQRVYNDDTYSMWRDGWFEELKYCDYVMAPEYE